MTIKTERLTLRPFTMRDLKTTHAYASDPENTRYMIYLPNRTKRETKQFLKRVTGEWKKEGQLCYEFAVVLEGRHIGAVSLQLDETRQKGYMGWILHKAYHDKGYATEAAKAVASFAQDTLGVKKLTAFCDYRNAASARVMEKLSMTLESDDGMRRYRGSDEDVPELKYSVKTNL